MFTTDIIQIIFQALEKLLVSNMGLDADEEEFDSMYNDHEA